tara:strand:+ start:1573 stop:1896 length:324 start_codon:yes stop_codon:yes gene_type:complete
MNEETEKKIQQLQLLEQNLQNVIMQKQTFQMQLVESENALKELDKSKKDAYKIIGTLMVSSDKGTLTKELKEQKDVLDLRIKNLEKQEKNFKEKAEDIQKEVMKEIK